MNVNYKLKTRQTKQEPSNRRIRTQANQNTKKISFYLNKPTRQPLQQNKKILNQTQSNQSNTLTAQIKRQKPIKSIGSKNITTTSKMPTQYQKSTHVINLGQKNAIDKIFKRQEKKDLQFYYGFQKNKQKQQKPKQTQRKMQGANRYMCEDKVGSGTFGVVYKARDKKTLQIVAIKRVFQDKKYKNRQLQILKILNHPNVLKMRDCFFTYDGQKQYLNVVMDYFQSNLYDSIQKYRSKVQIPRLKIKVLAYQIFRSLLYLNSIGIAHRDIKPQNILVNDTNWKLIMCDFGSAKKLQAGQPNIAYICSRCYRAPQLIFGNTAYTTQIDMWSAGCVLVQMITMEPIFRAQSNIDQLVEIIKILGTPSYSQMLQMNPQCDFQKYQLPKIGAKNWQRIIKRKNLGEQFYDLVKNVLKYSPVKRFTPYDALMHPFFDQIKNEQIYYKIKKQFNIPSLFDFNLTCEIDQKKARKLTPAWYQNQHS